ncbi:MAG: hypothetical protein IKN81_10895 [Oscillospiraceae bacterium]|nr:hypothetical protein [Oscillospiraceae bacterium]
MLRWFGAGLILASALLTRRALLETDRAAQRMRRALASAFEGMEAEVRTLLTPLPILLRRPHGAADRFFAAVTRELQYAELPQAWRTAAAELPLLPEERETVAQMGARLTGDERTVCGALALAASQLRRAADAIDAQRTQKERLVSALCLGAGALLALMLL